MNFYTSFYALLFFSNFFLHVNSRNMYLIGMWRFAVVFLHMYLWCVLCTLVFIVLSCDYFVRNGEIKEHIYISYDIIFSHIQHKKNNHHHIFTLVYTPNLFHMIYTVFWNDCMFVCLTYLAIKGHKYNSGWDFDLVWCVTFVKMLSTIFRNNHETCWCITIG